MAIKNGIISILPKTINATNNHFKLMSKEGETIPTEYPVVENAEVASNKEFIKLEPS